MVAEKRTTSAAGKKPATKSSSATKKNAVGKRSSQRSAAQKKASGQMSVENIRQRNQMRAVVLFACAIFLACLVLVPGDNLWKWAHEAFLGIFGSWAMVWPILMVYVAIVTALEKPRGSISGKVWLSALIIVLFCMTGYVFSGILPASGTKFFAYIGSLYTANSGLGGGVVGGMLGLPLIRGVGETGAKIIVLLVLFVAMMILTGTTLVNLINAVRRPVNAVSNGIQIARERRKEERAILDREEAEYGDIPIETQLPAHPVRSEPSLPATKSKDARKKSKEKSDALERIKEVFGFEEVPQSDPHPAEETPIPEPIEEKPAVQPVPTEPIEEKEAVSAVIEKADGPIWEKEEPKIEEKPHEDPPVATAKEMFQYESSESVPGSYIFPPVTMLAQSSSQNPAREAEELQSNGEALVEVLKSFGVQTKILDICRGPSVTRYEIQPAPGVRINKITNLADDLALNLAATSIRIEAPIPGKTAVGIEMPNKTRSTVRMRELVESNAFQTAQSKVSVALGRDITGQPVVADLAEMPHLLIAGTTGSGKSVCINSLIISMLYKASPDEVRFLMIDPKAVELTEYNGMPHMLVPVVTDPKKASGALSWAVTEMTKRYSLFSENNVRNLEGYNSLAKSMEFEDENGQPMPALPQIVIIIDELADLMMTAPKEVEDSILRLAQKARAAGMHLVVATQRPSVDVVTGIIKANIPSRIALTVANAIDSRTILDEGGADKLLGRGDMLFAPVTANKPVRVQGCYLSDDEISSIVNFVKKSKALEYDASVLEEIERNAANTGNEDSRDSDEDSAHDPMLDEAIKCVVEAGQASTSLLQRRLRLGYARAGRIIDEMEQLGVVGPHEGSKPRQVLMTYAQWMERNMQKADIPDNGE